MGRMRRTNQPSFHHVTGSGLGVYEAWFSHRSLDTISIRYSLEILFAGYSSADSLITEESCLVKSQRKLPSFCSMIQFQQTVGMQSE